MTVGEVETPAFFASGEDRLFGILHTPERPIESLAVVFLNGGLQNRSGPQRLYVKCARRLAAAGFVCLRMDFPGLGESEGDDPETHFDCFDPSHASNAMNYLTETVGIDRFALLGLCAGARAAVRAAARDPRAQALVAWGMPVLSAEPDAPANPDEERQRMSSTAARSHLDNWRSKLFRPSAWGRLLRSEETARQRLKRIYSVVSGLVAGGDSPTGFLDELRSYVDAGRSGLFVYGEEDRTPLSEFRECFPEIAAAEHPSCGARFIKAGDHTFTAGSAEAELIEATRAWLERQAVNGDHGD